MSTNCLVTKLKGVVNNSNLDLLGMIVIVKEASTFDASNSITLKFDQDTTIKAVGFDFVDDSGESIGNTLIIAANTNISVRFGNNAGRIEIPKYALTRLDYNGAAGTFMSSPELQKLHYSPITTIRSYSIGTTEEISSHKETLTSVQIIEGALSGLIDELGDCVSLTNLFVSANPNISGNISSLGKLTALSTLNLYGTNVTGTLESFVQSQRLNGRTTCENLSFNGTTIIPNTITFNGVALSGATRKNLSWTENTITFDGTTVNA